MKRRKRRKNKGALLVIMFVMCYFCYNYISLSLQVHKQQGIRNDLQAELKQEQDRSDELNSELDQINSDQYIESLAREYFGLVYPEEKVIIEVEPNKN